jgi:hypothetical protein
MEEFSTQEFAPSRHLHWTFFETIEEDLVEYSRYLEFHKDNFKAFSIKLTRLYLSICSEIDVVLKMICKKLDEPTERSDINHYRRVILKAYPAFPTVSVLFKRERWEVKPWLKWKTNQNPQWWTSYQNVKHERNVHYSDANLENVLVSAAGLLVALVFVYQKELSRNEIGPDFVIFGFDSNTWLQIQMGTHLEREELWAIALPSQPPPQQ